MACKLASDPLYPAVHEALRDTSLPLLDVGCGMGVLAFYLRQRGWIHPLTGLDFDARKIDTARALAPEFPPLGEFLHGDACTVLPAHHGSVTILDILQFFAAEDRNTLLENCAARVAPGGQLVIRISLMDDSWRFRITRLVDRMAKLVNWMQSPPVHYPRSGEVESILTRAGLQGSFRPLWGHTPFNSWLGVFHRPQE